MKSWYKFWTWRFKWVSLVGRTLCVTTYQCAQRIMQPWRCWKLHIWDSSRPCLLCFSFRLVLLSILLLKWNFDFKESAFLASLSCSSKWSNLRVNRNPRICSPLIRSKGGLGSTELVTGCEVGAVLCRTVLLTYEIWSKSGHLPHPVLTLSTLLSSLNLSSLSVTGQHLTELTNAKSLPAYLSIACHCPPLSMRGLLLRSFCTTAKLQRDWPK